MKVGDYVRTKGGILWKPNIIEDYDENSYIFDDMYIYGKEEIYKSSPNIIDLIEVEDYVNGHIVNANNGKDVWCGDEEGIITYDSEDIKSIVTKEQFESMEYRIDK